LGLLLGWVEQSALAYIHKIYKEKFYEKHHLYV
jgi:hypothetical protein